MTAEARFEDLAAFLWSTADMLLRPGGIEQEHYGRVILPFTVLRRLDCVLEPTRQAVWDKHEQLKQAQIENVEYSLRLAAGVAFYNTSKYNFRRLIEDPDNLTGNFTAWIGGFSPGVELVLERFGFAEVRKTVEGKGMLYKLLKHFYSVDLHPDRVPNAAMGAIFEELVRRFSDNIDENAGQYFTPREVVDLMADLVVLPDGRRLAQPGTVRTVYDPCCGTGGMLFGARGRIEQMNRAAEIHVYGQENAARIWAVCAADLMIASRDGRDVDNIKYGSTLSDDQHAGEHFDYLLANPPYGYHWEEFDGAKVREEFRKGGRFVGLPRKTDGQMLFLQHMVDKMRPLTEGREGLDNGARMAIVMGGSPLFAGDAGSGESEVRRWIFEKDYCEAIIALPEQLFFNTPIGTYVWVLTNRKEPRRRGKVQLIDATDLWKLMPKSLGCKRRELQHAHIEAIKRLYLDMVDGERSRVLDPLELGYRRLRVERPLRLRLEVDATGTGRLEAEPAWMKFAQKEPDAAARIRQALDRLRGRIYMDRALFRKELAQAARDEKVSIPASVRKVIEGAYGESDEAAVVCLDAKGNPEPDPSLRSQSEETAPLTETDLDAWFEREVKPHVPDAWLDTEQRERTWRWRDVADDETNPARPGRVGYEVNFNRYFFKYEPPRALEEIDRELVEAEAALQEALRAVMGR